MEHLRFYKETDNSWFVDLPEWPGSKSDLAMVAGADTMLDMIAEGEREVYLTISENHLLGAERIIFKEMAADIGEGAYYRLETYRGIEFNHELWLCNVVLFVFNNQFPKQIFFSKIK